MAGEKNNPFLWSRGWGIGGKREERRDWEEAREGLQPGYKLNKV